MGVALHKSHDTYDQPLPLIVATLVVNIMSTIINYSNVTSWHGTKHMSTCTELSTLSIARYIDCTELLYDYQLVCMYLHSSTSHDYVEYFYILSAFEYIDAPSVVCKFRPVLCKSHDNILCTLTKLY